MSDVIVTAYAATPLAHATPARSRAAWIAWAAATLVAAAALFIVLASISAPVPERALRGSTAVAALAFAFVGLRIATRQPANAVGWLVLAMGFAYSVIAVSEEAAIFALAGRADPAVARSAMTIGQVAGTFPLVPAAFVLLLFPDGRPYRRAWLAAGWFVTAAGAVLAVSTATIPFDESILTSSDPFLVRARSLEAAPLYTPLLRAVTLGLVLCAVPLVLRLRAARGAEQQQIKWVVSAAALAVVVNFLANVFFDVRGLALLQLAGILSVPAAIAVAMQRYRLYDIDALIGRALTYGLLTTLLAAIVAAVLGFTQRAFIAITGESSEAVLVLTTVVLVTVFTPLRETIQRVIDARLKPGQSLAAFTEQARIHTELSSADRLVAQFAEIAARTVDAGSYAVGAAAAGEPNGLVIELDVEHRVALGPRADGSPYTARQIASLREAAQAVREALTAAR